MNNNKVILPRDVAEAIEKLRSYGFSNWNVMDKAQGAICSEPDLTLHKWAFAEEGEGTPDVLMSALVNGYTIEQTREEKVREYYEESINRKDNAKMEYIRDRACSEAVGILTTINILGIKIEGVNA